MANRQANIEEENKVIEEVETTVEQVSNDEFITKKKDRRKGYTTSIRETGTRVVIVDHKRITEAEKLEVEMLVKAGYQIKSKKDDINRADMIRYVKKNYEEEELKKLMAELNKIGTVNAETTLTNTFMTVKSWFKDRYKYYPKGKDYKFTDKEKQARYEKAFAEHAEELKNKN